MKNKHYFCRNKIWIMATLWLFASCYDSELWNNVPEQPTKGKVTITAEEAQASFEDEIMSKVTRGSSTRKQDLIRFSKRQFPFGDIVPKWSSGEASSVSKFANYETPIRSSYLYRAWRHKRIGKSKKKQWMCTKVIHKLLVVKDAKTDKMYNYIELLIPTIHFLNHHRNFNFNQLKNDGNMLDYSGLKVYTTLDGYLIRVNEYRNGRKVKGVYLGGTVDKGVYLKKKHMALAILKNTRISIKMPKVMTRSYDEFEYEDGSLDIDEYGNIWIWDSDCGEWILTDENIYDGEDDEDDSEIIPTDPTDPFESGGDNGNNTTGNTGGSDSGWDIDGGWLGEVDITGNIPDPDPYDPNDFYEDLHNTTGNGSSGNEQETGSSGGSGGNVVSSSDSLASPKEFFGKYGDILLEPIFPRTMIPQTTVNRCVPAIISFLDRLLGGSVTEQDVVDYYNTKYAYDSKTNNYYYLDNSGGMPNNKISAVVLHYFNCDYKTDYRAALEDCFYVLTNFKTSTGDYHEVLIFGCDNDGNVIYMDPAAGMTYRVGAGYFFSGNDNGRVTIYVGGKR